MAELAALLALMLIIGLFWQHRQQAEWARMQIQQHCRQLQLQLLSIHYAGADWSLLRQGRLVWRYDFEFTSVPERQFSGHCYLHGNDCEFQLQPYPEAESSGSAESLSPQSHNTLE